MEENEQNDPHQSLIEVPAIEIKQKLKKKQIGRISRENNKNF